MGRLRELGFKYKKYWNDAILEVPCSIYTNENNHPGTAIFKRSKYSKDFLFLYINNTAWGKKIFKSHGLQLSLNEQD